MTDNNKAKIIAQIIFLVFMAQKIHLFVTKESVGVKTLVAISFVIFLALSLTNMKSIRNWKRQES